MLGIRDEKELLDRLFLDVDNCDKKRIVFLAGHFPLLYPVEKEEAVEAFDHWGIFSKYSLELACIIGEYAIKKGKLVSFVFFVDDHMYEDISELSATPRSRRRDRLYKRMSGKNAKLPEEYKKIMQKHGFSEKDVIRQNQMKNGREDCLYFSEKILRESKREIDNPCAREYTEFLEDSKYFSKKDFYMITFGPQRCKDNICNFAIPNIKGLSSSHIFMDTMAKLSTRKQLYSLGKGIHYIKD